MQTKEYYKAKLDLIPRTKSRDLITILVDHADGSSDIIRRAAPMSSLDSRDWMMEGYVVQTTYEFIDISHELDRRASYDCISDEMRMDALADVGLDTHLMIDALMQAMYTNPLALKLAILHRLPQRADELIGHVSLMDLVLDYSNPLDCDMFIAKIKGLFPMGFRNPKYV